MVSKIKALNTSPQSNRQQEESRDETLQDIALYKEFLWRLQSTPKKEKNKQRELHQTKKFLYNRGTMGRVKRGSTQ